MSDSFSLVGHPDMCLVVFLSFWSAHIEKEPCQVEILPVACGPVQFYQTHLNDLMSGVNLYTIPSEITVDKIGRFQGYIKQCSLTCSLIVGNCSFIKVADIV